MKGCQVASWHAPVIQVLDLYRKLRHLHVHDCLPQQRNEVLPPCSIPQTAPTCKIRVLAVLYPARETCQEAQNGAGARPALSNKLARCQATSAGVSSDVQKAQRVA